MLLAYFGVFLARYKYLRPHVGNLFQQSAISYLSKLPKYIFHIVFLGRYFSTEAKKQVYSFCESPLVLAVVYGLLIIALQYVILRYRKISIEGRAMFLFFVFALLNICFLMPLPFPGEGLLVFYDRYTYFTGAFIYVLLAMFVASFVRNKYVLIILLSIYIDLNLYFTIIVNKAWIDSDAISTKLLRNFPPSGNKIVLLLNIPENMNGAPMIGAQPEGMFRMMREMYTGAPEKNKIYDVVSYNMSADYDGAHVEVLNDGVIRVTLNHWGNWWWYEGHGATSYENEDYKVNMRDMGHWYDLTLKHPNDQYLLLFSVGDTWKKVDLDKRNVPQE
jgi:hypothetical protein